MEKTPNDVYSEVAQDSGLSAEDIEKIGKIESQHGKFNEPLQGGSARGLFQFQPTTAEHLLPGSSNSLSDINTQADLMKKYLAKTNPANVEDAYAMHNLGPTGGRKLIEASDEELIRKILSKGTINGNKGLYGGKTVGEAKANIKKKLEERE